LHFGDWKGGPTSISPEIGPRPQSDDLKEVAHRARQAVELRDDYDIIPAQLNEKPIKLISPRDRRYLLGEYLVGAGGAKVALLGLETGFLFKR
jgi:hypothetical protein